MTLWIVNIIFCHHVWLDESVFLLLGLDRRSTATTVASEWRHAWWCDVLNKTINRGAFSFYKPNNDFPRTTIIGFITVKTVVYNDISNYLRCPKITIDGIINNKHYITINLYKIIMTDQSTWWNFYYILVEYHICYIILYNISVNK